MHIQIKRPAIAMIELIFAIVIMGIVLMSAPMLISTAAKSTTVALQQEGINEAVSRVSMIMTHEWDQNSINDSCISPVLHVSSSGDSALNEVGTSGRRIGVPLGTNSHTFKCGAAEFNVSSSGLEGTVKDDIDDFAGTTLVPISTGTGGTNYIETGSVSIADSVGYASDAASYNSNTFTYDFSGALAAGSSSTNIKAINVTLTSTHAANELSKTIILNGFSCNLGGYEFEWRQF